MRRELFEEENCHDHACGIGDNIGKRKIARRQKSLNDFDTKSVRDQKRDDPAHRMGIGNAVEAKKGKKGYRMIGQITDRHDRGKGRIIGQKSECGDTRQCRKKSDAEKKDQCFIALMNDS